MTRHLVFIHGRAQEGKDSIALKDEWLTALAAGMRAAGLSMPATDATTHFPYYGDTLAQLAAGGSPDSVVPVILRGEGSGGADEADFVREVLKEVQSRADLTDADVHASLLADPAGDVVLRRGIGSSEWVQAVLRLIDRRVPNASAASIAVATADVYHYLTRTATRRMIDKEVGKALDRPEECVVVAHSLGTVVAYNVLSQPAAAANWKTPEFITVGSPLAVRRIQEEVRGLAGVVRCPLGVRRWRNAMDERDIVALYPLEQSRFPLVPDKPAIENKKNVRNDTSNHHGISGYLGDADVARWIHEALTA